MGKACGTKTKAPYKGVGRDYVYGMPFMTLPSWMEYDCPCMYIQHLPSFLALHLLLSDNGKPHGRLFSLRKQYAESTITCKGGGHNNGNEHSKVVGDRLHRLTEHFIKPS